MSKTSLFDPVVTTTSTAVIVTPSKVTRRTQMLDPNVQIATGSGIYVAPPVVGGN